MKYSLAIAETLSLLLCFGLQSAHAAIRLEGLVVDDASGAPLAARIAITNAEGRFVEVDGQHAHVQYLGKRWCYVDGSFALTVPDSGAGIEIRRGFETRPLLATLTVTGVAHELQRTFRLRRWTELSRGGYLNGDIHAHLPVPREARLQMRAEDLNALNLLHMADAEYHLPVNEYFTGKLDTNSVAGSEIYVGQEIRDFQMGHLTLLKLSHLVGGYPDIGGGLEYWRGKPHWDLVPAMRAARAQNGMVVWSHVCSLPGEQLPVGIALGLVDGIELITWSDPTQFPNHWEPWLNSGMSQAEFPVMCALDLYYQFLNAGFRLPIAAGTDKFGEEIPLGSNRVFARTGPFGDYASWLAAIRAGKSFVSNGPILEFNVEGSRPGDVVEFSGQKHLKARVEARSILPFTTLEIVFNGETIGHKTIPIYSNAPVEGVYSMQLETTADFARSGWLAARVLDHPDLRNRILPRELSVFAHTSPVYFLRKGRPVRERASIAYLTKYVEGMIHWLGTQPRFATEEDLRAARREAEEALRIYRRL